ncbi:Sec1 family domain-containing protein MIP3 [Camellia lanceoleosa]|uniref:Sec1 family domain-containing protein MIP3 n=1 Tax=Camellia lanceoleosa TaxID=1840588 RepID=A0ACC0FGA8_9ERIC|nr:Sec1 family domain-containing protein MIP3 [Camellia lanceoleosa]
MSGFPSYCWRLLQCKYRGEEISEHIEDATVYLDAGCTESFEFLGAYPLLLELGAHAVCSLENMSSLDMGLRVGTDPASSPNP